jgi:hypothetical protein
MTLMEKMPVEPNAGRALMILATNEAHARLPSSHDLPNMDRAKLPANYAAARAALAQCVKVDEAKAWADKAAAIASYAKQARDDELGLMAVRIRARAIRRCGELLSAVEPAKNQHHARARAANGHGTRQDAARRAGLSQRQAKQAVRVANVPEPEFEEQLKGKTPTIERLARQGTKHKTKVVNLASRKLVRLVDRFDQEMRDLDLSAAVAALSKKEARGLDRRVRAVEGRLRRLRGFMRKGHKIAPRLAVAA